MNENWLRILVTGGREYDDAETVRAVLGAFYGGILVHGDCRGADRLAKRVWNGMGRRDEAHPADWSGQGKTAGFIRNAKMASLGATLCVAFPGGNGTAHMVSCARAVGIPILEVR